MKRLIFALPALILMAACEKPQQQMDMVCGDDFLIHADLYRKKAELKITKKSEESIKAEEPELYNVFYSMNLPQQVQNIGDETTVTLYRDDDDTGYSNHDKTVIFKTATNPITLDLFYSNESEDEWTFSLDCHAAPRNEE